MLQQIDSLTRRFFGDREAKATSQVDNNQRRTPEDVQSQIVSLREKYAQRETDHEEKSKVADHTNYFTDFALTPEQKKQIMTELLGGLVGLSNNSIQGRQISELLTEGHFFSFFGGYEKEMATGASRKVQCEDKEVAYLAVVVDHLAQLVAMVEDALPSDKSGNVPGSYMDMRTANNHYMSDLQSTHSFIEDHLSTVLPSDLVEEIKILFDKIISRLRSKFALRGKEYSIPYFKNPSAEHS